MVSSECGPFEMPCLYASALIKKPIQLHKSKARMSVPEGTGKEWHKKGEGTVMRCLVFF